MGKSKSLLFVFGLLLLVGCTVDLPSYVISERKMEKILYDYHLAQGMAESQGGDVEANRYLYVQKVFEKYHVTEAQFDTSMVWYSGHASHLQKMYEHIEARLERESNAAGLNIPEEDKFARFTAEGDTANIWSGKQMFFLHGNREQNLYTVVIPADSTFQRGDYFMFRCSNRFVVKDSEREGFVILQVKYDNDSTVSNTMMITSDYDVTVNIPSSKALLRHDIRSVSCTFYYAFDEGKEDAFRMWAISKPVLLRYHSKTIATDTLSVVPDSLSDDSLPAVRHRNNGEERLSPEEFRSNQRVDKKINVVQKKRVVLPAQPQRVRRR